MGLFDEINNNTIVIHYEKKIFSRPYFCYSVAYVVVVSNVVYCG